MVRLRNANRILSQNSHYVSTIGKWNKFCNFIESSKSTDIDVNDVLTFFMILGESGRNTKTFHISPCDNNSNCSCPRFSSVNTIVTYRSALRLMFSYEFPNKVNPFDDFKVDCFLSTLNNKFIENRVVTKQAKALTMKEIQERLKKVEFDAIFERDELKKWALLRNLLICKIMAHFGCRASDVLRLKWADIVICDSFVRFSFFHTKTCMSNGPRIETLYNTQDVLSISEMLSNWIPQSHSVIPFTLKKHLKTEFPPHMSSSSINQFVKGIFGPEFSSPSLRVSKACDLALDSCNSDEIAKSMGMKSPLTAKRYSQQKLSVSKDGRKRLIFI